MKAGTAVRDSWHLYEAVIGNARVWLKLQASCPATEPAALFEYRFTGADYTPADGHRPLTPFRLSERSRYIANWSSIVESLPAGWDDEEYRIIETAYPWCETLADGCDCHGTKGRLDVVHCSDFGVVNQRQERSGKTRNIRYEYYIQEMEQRIAHRDEPPKVRRAGRSRTNIEDAHRRSAATVRFGGCGRLREHRRALRSGHSRGRYALARGRRGRRQSRVLRHVRRWPRP